MPKHALESSTSVHSPYSSVVNTNALLASIAAVEDRLPSMLSIDSIATITRKITQVQSHIQHGRRREGFPDERVNHIDRVRRRVETENLFNW